MIAPEGWLALDTEYYENNTPLTKGMFDAGFMTVIEVATLAMIEHGDMTAEQTLEDIKIIDDCYWAKVI